jgi:nucleoside-diphosphate-sugar epimerase
MGSERGDGYKRLCSLGEGTGSKESDYSEAPQRATASRLVPTHQIDPPLSDEDKRQHGYSRDHRPDCVQVVIALVVTPQGFPLAYEVLAGNTADNTTLKDFLARIERQYGKAQRTWLMDRRAYCIM